MKSLLTLVTSFALLLFVSDSRGAMSNSTLPAPQLVASHQTVNAVAGTPGAPTGAYVLTAWSELGMHCIDGKDYSIFAVLPPFNTIRATLIQRAAHPVIVTSGVNLTYQAMRDASGSINTISATKTNFWSFVRALFLASPPPDVGLANFQTQSHAPHLMRFNSQLGVYEATGVPTVPYDDRGRRNAYPMVRVVASDLQGNVLATADTVMAVSDELSCNLCHASNSDPAAKPASGWENDPDPGRDTKLNILKYHDEVNNIRPFLSALIAKGYLYQASLYQTAKSGTPILCDACHASNALPGTGLTGIEPETTAMHRNHGPVINPVTGISLDNSSSPFGSCYLCHPGLRTRCQRGAMERLACMNCHGNVSRVGDPRRVGWMTLPNCQMCHNAGTRYTSAFDSTGQWRQTTDRTFATNPNTPAPGFSLYRFSVGHGNLFCTSCHNAPHAEYPTSQRNDSILPLTLQGYNAKLTECNICHTSLTTTPNGGPHGTHLLGQQAWVNAHGHYAEDGHYQVCAYCHGSDYRGTPLSITKVQRNFTGDDGQPITLAQGDAVGCYDCHNGPNGD